MAAQQPVGLSHSRSQLSIATLENRSIGTGKGIRKQEGEWETGRDMGKRTGNRKADGKKEKGGEIGKGNINRKGDRTHKGDRKQERGWKRERVRVQH